MYKLDKNVPLPRIETGKVKSELRLTLEAMEVNHSFYLPIMTNNYRHQVWKLGKHLGRKFAIRKWEDGYRVWRVG